MFPFPTGQARSDQQQYDRTGDRGNQAAERADGNESEQTEKPTAQNAAIIPTIRFSQNPDPLPLTIRLATYPATSPMSIYQRKYIIGGFKLYISYSNSYATTGGHKADMFRLCFFFYAGTMCLSGAGSIASRRKYYYLCQP